MGKLWCASFTLCWCSLFILYRVSAVQLLHKFSVRATETSIKLLKVIKNPITDHLPVGSRKIGTSFSADKVISPKDLVPEDEPIVFVIGAMAHGQVSFSVNGQMYEEFLCPMY